jgi:hypothetical protein
LLPPGVARSRRLLSDGRHVDKNQIEVKDKHPKILMSESTRLLTSSI